MLKFGNQIWSTFTVRICISALFEVAEIIFMKFKLAGNLSETTCLEEQSVFPLCNSDPKWSPWSSWEVCNKKCGGGVKTRTRKCTGRVKCPGKSKQTQKCNTHRCQGNFLLQNNLLLYTACCNSGVESHSSWAIFSCIAVFVIKLKFNWCFYGNNVD